MSIAIAFGVIGMLDALAVGEVLDVVVLVAMLAFIEPAPVLVVSKKLGPEMKGSSSESSASLADRRGISCRGWAGR